MTAESQFHIPCVCGALVLTHARETRCERCGRLLVVEWGKGPESAAEPATDAGTRKAESPTALLSLSRER
jgi:hypothetical protein